METTRQDNRRTEYFTNNAVKRSDVLRDQMNNRGYDTTELESIVLINEGFDS